MNMRYTCITSKLLNFELRLNSCSWGRAEFNTICFLVSLLILFARALVRFILIRRKVRNMMIRNTFSTTAIPIHISCSHVMLKWLDMIGVEYAGLPQFSPVILGGQIHLYVPISFTQVPPFVHGLASHSFISVSQRSPMNPWHLHIGPLFPSSHTPPWIQGFGLQYLPNSQRFPLKLGPTQSQVKSPPSGTILQRPP